MDTLLTDLTTAVHQGVAAKVLLVAEAGGVVTDLRGAHGNQPPPKSWPQYRASTRDWSRS
jgi:fructose-1,6-bisphosphatase/inositol monophosphatase family enzyme